MAGNVKLSDQQYQVVQALWAVGEGSAKEVQTQSGLDLAHTTISTILSRLEKRGILSSQSKGRERVYKSLISENDVQRSMVSSLVSTLFKGDPKALLAHLVREGDFDDNDLVEIQSLLHDEQDPIAKEQSND